MRFLHTALSQLMDMDMDVSVPELCIDMGGAILTYPMSRWVIVSDDILLIENIFHMSGEIFKDVFFSFRSRKIWELCFHGSGSSAMDKIIVGIAEGKVARENQVLISYALWLLCGGLSLRPQGAHSGHGPYYTSGKEVFSPLG